MTDFITIDFETATNSPESAISIGLVKYRNFKPVGLYYSLIRPPRLYIRPDFTAIHGLTTKDVQDSPCFDYLWEHEICGFMSGEPLAAHKAQFDMNVLRGTLTHYTLPVPPVSYFCSLALSRRTWPGLSSYSLSALAEHFHITYAAHNALADAQTCGRVISLCAEKALRTAGKKRFTSLQALLEASGVELKKL
jgi:DNA polymerase-3 subunit epsilon